MLGAGAAQLGLLEAAREHGVFTIAVDRDPSAPGFRFASRRAIISAEDEVGIERLALAERLDGLIAPGIDFPVAIAARIAARLGLPHPLSPDAAVVATSKLRQRHRLAEAGVPQPRYGVAPTLVEARAAAEQIGYPLVVKPPDRQGQKGLAVARTPAELEAAFDVALGASRGGLVLLEELVDGPEVTVNAFSVAGRFVPLTVTDRVVAEPPAFGVALAHVWPSLSDGEAVSVTAAAAVRALGIENGPSYTQLRIGPDGPQVIEVAARLGGGHDAELVETATGVPLNDLAIDAALGRPLSPPVPSRLVGGAVTRFLVAPPGVLTGVDVPEGLEGVERVRIYREPGHVQGPLRRGSDRVGAVLVVGDSREAALERADRAAAAIAIGVEDAQVA